MSKNAICKFCGGPLRASGPLWLHDNSNGFYAGQQMTHDAEPNVQPPVRDAMKEHVKAALDDELLKRVKR